ncbi:MULTISPECIES: bacillithiol biosynthesis deacetylase BshB1 [Olivibacter]|uniref:LmbE family protein n=3 Tax=Sphingobacteriaceae TaxID=84566 RepID=F4C3T4_SPHS2|nr:MULTISPECIES: bacillithiol biosynthesis deacetylase BshB1 [Olivibacter]MCL4638222.1 bacillithiol biosynthesis deacetylase BshB1 [Olivibacter sp. UJ_SKK_5.1]MDM8174862.1 bacillithiol biosynthesis deacetylase BshB1 [Olivibacter sp. 47]MDX3913458.1 bacillithiol biosynthesis deacetylase BshB1 [Pseudosphingobacterium sp.]QEL01648.1 bacillithiol biosynthesis deacetylase BshB1 [Olivibacter sp. LS-1]
MKLDILVITVHPDDAELGCSGTILKHVALGKRVGIVDLTRGELGTRGTVESRAKEAADSSIILGLSARENLGLRDGFFKNEEYEQLELIKAIRKYQPEIIIGNALYDRHPDHGRAGELITDACFLSGLRRIETKVDETYQEPHRPRLLLQLIQDHYIKPDIVVDVSDYWDQKIESIRAFKSQFFNEDYAVEEPQTYISNPDFLNIIEARAREYGKYIGAKYAEGFTCKRLLGVDNLFNLR